MGPSSIVPFIPDEPAQVGHARRFHANMCHRGDVQAWCFERAVTVIVGNQGQHWRFIYGDSFAEWWPSTAKLVFNRQYRHGVRCHDYEQVITALSRRWKLEYRAMNTTKEAKG